MSIRLMLTTLTILALTACNSPGDRRGGMITPATDAGASSGIAPGRALTSLSAAETRSVCTYVSAQVGTGMTECGEGVTVNGTTVDECVEDFGSPPAGCTATVGDVERCSELLGDNPCAIVSGSLPAECSFLASCATSSG